MGLMKCPDCGREISENAKQCPFCGSPFENENLMSCPSCGHSVSKKANACPNCGHPFNNQTIKVRFMKISGFGNGIGNKVCSILDKNGYLLARCNHGETVELKINSIVDATIQIAFPLGPPLSLKAELEPQGEYQVKLNSPWSSWKQKIILIKKAELT